MVTWLRTGHSMNYDAPQWILGITPLVSPINKSKKESSLRRPGHRLGFHLTETCHNPSARKEYGYLYVFMYIYIERERYIIYIYMYIYIYRYLYVFIYVCVCTAYKLYVFPTKWYKMIISLDSIWQVCSVQLWPPHPFHFNTGDPVIWGILKMCHPKNHQSCSAKPSSLKCLNCLHLDSHKSSWFPSLSISKYHEFQPGPRMPRHLGLVVLE